MIFSLPVSSTVVAKLLACSMKASIVSTQVTCSIDPTAKCIC